MVTIVVPVMIAVTVVITIMVLVTIAVVMEAITIVVVVIPIAVIVPTTFVYFPPFMIGVPAALPLLLQRAPRVVRLLAFVAVLIDGAVQLLIGLGDASLAIIVIGAQARRAAEHQKTGQRCGNNRHPSNECMVHRASHVHYLQSVYLEFRFQLRAKRYVRRYLVSTSNALAAVAWQAQLAWLSG